ncbi:putative metal-dependent hydrolase [Adhaeribacter aerolatus]|uniref:Putative metal-dependent hydrolase n=1 Tax=Adhaeribacter aerolatus TaxID=670289 RepID=A0A512ASF6_9BACT|nr:bacillithiol transferase BstA [Adhaeribacter aerolatus]GEO02497.1 putative metal-dependent hydrolase [Adhaeribacter aerolatus]
MPNNLSNTYQDDLLRYPIGKFNAAAEITNTAVQSYINDIAALPAQLRRAVTSLSEAQLNTPYRPGGWTIRQVVHHLADSHMNSYIRFKLALTEELPTIKPYEEDRWAELADGKTEPVEVSLVLLEALHHRWVVLLKSLTPAQWQKAFNHPVSGITPLAKAVGLYAWHGQHHLAHITNTSN